MTAPPVVGVLCGRSPLERYSTHRGYVSSITAVGGIAILLPGGPDADPRSSTAMVDHCHAIVATGGGDVDPEAYGGSVTSSADLLMEVDPARDAAEFAVVQHAMAQGKRVLGICRGAQLLAVAGGGTLVHDLAEKGLPGHWDDEERQYEAVHPIAAESRSLAARVLGTIDRVNSIHHQAIADPGQTMRATAWSPDGVIEAIEGPALLGVQWHPERLTATDSRHLAVFSWVVQ
jgi:putative glutamine amidotransferase